MASQKAKPRSTEEAAPVKHSNPFVYVGTIVILVITVIAFVIVPSFSGPNVSGERLSFGSYAGRPIVYEAGSYFAEQVERAKAELEDQVSADQAGSLSFIYQVWNTAFQRTALRFALLEEAKASGVVVSEEAVNDRLIADPSFQLEGRFSRERFAAVSKFEKNRLLERIREDLLIQRYTTDVLGVGAVPGEIAFLKDSARGERLIEYAAVPYAEYPDSERQAWAAANAALFRQARLSKITVQSGKKDAEAVKAKVVSGAVAFDEAAKQYSKDPYAERGGSWGVTRFHDLRSELKSEADAEAVFALASGELSPVFETVQGSWVFYKADEAASAADFSDSATLKAVGDYMNAWEKGSIEAWALERANAFGAALAANDAAAIASSGLSLKEAGPFPLNLGSSDAAGFPLAGTIDTAAAPELAGASADRAFLLAAFSQAEGQVSKAYALTNHAVVFRVKAASNAADDKLAILDYYLPYYTGQAEQSDMAKILLGDERFKDDFDATFFRVFASGS